MVVEDWVWEAVGFLARLVGRLGLVRRIEAALEAASPPFALLAFAVPVILVEPAKLWGFALIAQGRFGLGLLTLAFAYGLGTVLLVRVWNVCKPALMTYRPIAWSVHRLAWFRAAIHAWLERLPAWRRLIALRDAARAWARAAARQMRARFH
ncbi:MAG: hypothetical protein ACOVVK_15905 [Elsteraceae bacterium]